MNKKAVVAAAVMVAVVMMVMVNFAQAKDEKGKTEVAAQAQQMQSPAEQAKAMLVGNLQAMQSQEVRLMVLQQLLAREAGDLRQMQAVFCDQYKLDVEKWRKGLYRYNDKEAKFTEVKEGQ